MRYGFGLDLAGYSTGKAGFATAAQHESHIEVSVYSGHIFAKKVEGDQPFGETVAQERALIEACANKGNFMVDVPIDLQGLPAIANADFAWQLIWRPVDYAFAGLPALAGFLGAPTARFLHLLGGLSPNLVGTRIFETYPAMSLEFLGFSRRGYKGSPITFHKGSWVAGTDPELAQLAADLGFRADDGLTLTDDEFDAAICALTGIVEDDSQLRGKRLDAEITSRINSKLPPEFQREFTAPSSYVLLEKLPAFKIHIRKKAVRLNDDILRELS